MQPKVDKVSEFEKSWWKWWKGLQPEWRAVSDVVGPLDSSHRLGLVDGADWSVVKKHGRNTFFLVMVTLVWWGVALPAPSTSDEGWMVAIQDVGWVLAGLTGSRFMFHINYYLLLIYLASLHSLPMPISTSTLQCPSHSCRNPQESSGIHRIPQDSSGMEQDSAGMGPESTGMGLE